MNIQIFFNKLPYPIRQGIRYTCGILPPPFLYGNVFRKTYSFLNESQWWDRTKINEYQVHQLRKLLQHAYSNVPYFKKLFNEAGLQPINFESVADLQRLPYMTKDLFRTNLPNLIANNYPRNKLHYVTTSGSTGNPLGLYWEKNLSTPKELAFVWRQWNWAGYKFGDKRVILRGNIINKTKGGKRYWWEYNPIDKSLVLSPFDMTEDNLPGYIEKINDFKPKAIQGFPSALYILAKYLSSKNLVLKNINAAFTSSETLYPYQRKIIEKTLRTKIYDHYGTTERCALIMQCEENAYHIIPEYGIIELVDKNDKPVTREGEAGEIIATGFNNNAVPFIRYKTGDIAIYTTKESCSCGRNFPRLKKISGRTQDYFVDKNNSLITFIASEEALWAVKEKINTYQYVQNEPGKILLNIDVKKKLSLSEIESIKNNFSSFYSGFNIEVNFTDNINRTKSGKFRLLIQNIPFDL